MGATATIVLPWFVDRLQKGLDWRTMAWWLRDHLPFASATFFQRLGAFNIQSRDGPERRVRSWREPRGILNLDDDLLGSPFRDAYAQFPPLR